MEPIINSFTTGELSELLFGRIDIQHYFKGAETIENFAVMPFGGVIRIPGFHYVAGTKDSTKTSRLIPFSFNVDQSYILEFGDYYIRFYKDQGQIQSGGSAYEITSPYSVSDLEGLQFAQDSDVMYITSVNHYPQKLSRTGHTAWTIADIPILWGPFRTMNSTATTITPSATTGTVTLTASTSVFSSTHIGSFWALNDGYVKITGYTSSTVVTGDVKNTLSGAGATTDWQEGSWSDYRGFPRAVTIYEQRLFFAGNNSQPQTVWGSQSAGDYENFEAGTNDDDALKYTLGSEQVNVIRWLSSGKIMGVGTTGGVFTLSSGDSSSPLTPTNVVVKQETNIGCYPTMPTKIDSFVYYIQRDSEKLRQFTYAYESESYSAIDVTLMSEHVGSGGIKQLAFQLSPYSMLWCVKDDGTLSVLTRDITQKINAWTRVVVDGEVESVAVIPRGDGDYDEVWIIVKRYINGQHVRYVEFLEDFKFEIKDDGFYLDSGIMHDEPVTISGATQANPVVITATAHGYSNGDIVRIVKVKGMTELNYKKYTVANKTADTFELSGIDGTGYTKYKSSGEVRECVSSVLGLDHLEGEEVAILADGAVLENQTVSSGSITLTNSYGKIIVGLPYFATVTTLPVATGNVMATIQGRKKRIYETIVRLNKTLGGKIGYGDNLTDILYKQEEYDNSPAVYTGDKTVGPVTGYDTKGQVTVKQTQPLPMTIIAIMPQMVIE